MSTSVETPVASLTDRQIVLLSTALERGFFEIPREIGITELGEELGVSHQAVSEMKRRAMKSLVEAVVGARDVSEGYWIGRRSSNIDAYHTDPRCPQFPTNPRRVDRGIVEFHKLNRCEQCPSPFAFDVATTGDSSV